MKGVQSSLRSVAVECDCLQRAIRNWPGEHCIGYVLFLMLKSCDFLDTWVRCERLIMLALTAEKILLYS